jgi:VWFA-related protein
VRPASSSFFVLSSCLLIVPLAFGAQRFRSATDLIAVNVTVRDGDGRLATDLTRDRFEVFEDGRLQPVTQFTDERVPVSFAVLLDISESMFGSRIQDSRAAIEEFIGTLLHPEDEFAVLGFNHRHRLLLPWSDDRGSVPAALEPIRPAGSTAIYDAIVETLPLMDVRSRQRAALLVISDGADTASETTLREVRASLVRSEAFVYAVAIDPVNPRPLNVGVNVPLLRDITDQSGGRTLVVRDTNEMLAALARIAEELDSQYLIGYTAPGAADGQFHSIRVRIRDGDYRVRARNGYIRTPGPGSTRR